LLAGPPLTTGSAKSASSTALPDAKQPYLPGMEKYMREHEARRQAENQPKVIKKCRKTAISLTNYTTEKGYKNHA